MLVAEAVLYTDRENFQKFLENPSYGGDWINGRLSFQRGTDMVYGISVRVDYTRVDGWSGDVKIAAPKEGT